ncbi:hypothetical protein RND81_09G239100 [Saponaria officinalis]|uniref:Uncharacterized protein n=1 Tax=Saponaria officinalis TaxID=3572 RepID=A0AAW1IRG9_SAPOF
MESFRFPGEQYYQHDQHHAHYEPHEGVNNLMEIMQDMKSSLRSLIREEVEEVVRRVILPHLSSAPDSTPPAILRSLPRQTEPSASKKLYLRIDDTFLPETLFTMNKIQHQVDSLKVELVDDSGTRVEDDPVSSAKIRIVVLNGDFDVDDNDWSLEDFSKNLVRPRKDKACSLLKGKCEISLIRGVATVSDISFTDNSNRTVTFRLGAEVIKTSAGVDIKAAVSKPFAVKERRLLTDRKHEKPSPEDALWRLKNIRRDGPVYQRAKQANICTVNDFLQLLHTDPKKLRNILDVPETKWKDIVENAEACVLTDDLYIYYDDTAGIELLLDCAFNIVNVKFAGQISQLYEPLSDHQKEVVHEARHAAYKNRKELKPCTPMNQMQSEAELSCIYRISSINMQHHEASSMQIQPLVTWVPRIQSIYTQHSDATPINQGELVKHAYNSSLRSPSSCHVNHEKQESEISECELLDDPEWIDKMMADLIKMPEDPTENNPVTKLRVACYVSIAATMFMISGQQNHSPLKKKRKF